MNPWTITAKILKWTGIVSCVLLVLGCMGFVPYVLFVAPDMLGTWLTPPFIIGIIGWTTAFLTLPGWIGNVVDFLGDTWDSISSWWKDRERAWDERKEVKVPEDDPPPYKWDPETLGDLPHAYSVEDYGLWDIL